MKFARRLSIWAGEIARISKLVDRALFAHGDGETEAGRADQ